MCVCACVCLRCTIDLSLLSKEHTHKLDMPLEEGEGVLVLLVTLTASAAVSISDLSVNMLDDPQERHQILQRYVSYFAALCSSRANSFHRGGKKTAGLFLMQILRLCYLNADWFAGQLSLSLPGLGKIRE